ncbi:MAG: RNA methyltransferase [Clostridium sp.]|nr:RNA methyltransferase [Clostridium sp.]
MNSFVTDIPKIGRQTIAMVAGLGSASHRRKSLAFKAEGAKCVADTAGVFGPRMLIATAAWFVENEAAATDFVRRGGSLLKGTSADMERMSDFRCPPSVIAVYNLPAPSQPSADFGSTLAVALDGIQDPGNLGTILRTCDWFGIRDVVCSRETVDLYNPKSVQATMGAISRVNLSYVDSLADFLRGCAGRSVPVYGTFLGGDNLFAADFPDPCAGIVVLGNEGRGISPEVAAAVTRRLTIPSWPPGEPTSESLNVGAAAAIVLASFRVPLFRNNTSQSPLR